MNMAFQKRMLHAYVITKCRAPLLKQNSHWGYTYVHSDQHKKRDYDSLLRAILRESEAKLEMKNFKPPSFFVWR